MWGLPDSPVQKKGKRIGGLRGDICLHDRKKKGNTRDIKKKGLGEGHKVTRTEGEGVPPPGRNARAQTKK